MKRSLATLATLALVAGLFASAAFAHADLASSTPAAGSTVAAAPAVVTLNFSEALTPASTGKVSTDINRNHKTGDTKRRNMRPQGR